MAFVAACGGTNGFPSSRIASGDDAADVGEASQPEASIPDDVAPNLPDADPAESGDDDVSIAQCDGDWILPDATGFVAAASNASGITGSWYLHRDCDDYGFLDAGPAIPGTNCSLVSAPVPGSPFAPEPGTYRMCTTGSTVHALSDGELATRWGAYVALDLQSVGGVAQDFDAGGLRGFCFYLSGATIPAFRVRFPTDQGIGGTNWYQQTLQHEGWHQVLFGDLKQIQTTGNPFDKARLVSIEFEIPASRLEAIPWDFCIEALIALK